MPTLQPNSQMVDQLGTLGGAGYVGGVSLLGMFRRRRLRHFGRSIAWLIRSPIRFRTTGSANRSCRVGAGTAKRSVISRAVNSLLRARHIVKTFEMFGPLC